MNWLGFEARTFLGAFVGALCGAALFIVLLHAGIDFPVVVGASTGVCSAACARERSWLRGLVVGCLAIWAGAIAQRLGAPVARLDLQVSVFDFHTTLSGWRGPLHIASGVSAFLLASIAFKRGASSRIAGA